MPRLFCCCPLSFSSGASASPGSSSTPLCHLCTGEAGQAPQGFWRSLGFSLHCGDSCKSGLGVQKLPCHLSSEVHGALVLTWVQALPACSAQTPLVFAAVLGWELPVCLLHPGR